MPTLAEQLAAPDKRRAAISDLASLVDSEVSKKGGLSGIAIKTSYAVVKAIKPTFIVEVLNGMFDECVGKLEPVYAECSAAGRAGFAAKFNGKASQVADALLAITDGRAERTTHQTAKKAYAKLRPAAKKHVEEAVPGVCQVLLRHAAPTA